MLRLHEPQWLAPVRRAMEGSGHDASSLYDRFRSTQDGDADDDNDHHHDGSGGGGGAGSGVTDVSREAFVQVLEECGVFFR
jgi:hypothetical protein